jgi:hypothetical protein
MLDDFPENLLKSQNLILSLLDSPRCYWNFVYLKYTENNNTIILEVFDDALKIDGVRVPVSALTQQIIANKFGCLLPTAKISDLIYLLSNVKLTPTTRPISTKKSDILDNHSKIQAKLVNQPNNSLISNVGKDWVIDASWLGKGAINHGWQFIGDTFEGISGTNNPALLKFNNQIFKDIQWLGRKHNINHLDYSQVCRLVNRSCILNNKVVDLVDVLKDPKLCSIVSHSGPILNPFQPGAPLPEPFKPTEPKRWPLPNAPTFQL